MKWRITSSNGYTIMHRYSITHLCTVCVAVHHCNIGKAVYAAALAPRPGFSAGKADRRQTSNRPGELAHPGGLTDGFVAYTKDIPFFCLSFP